jgi:hypothetical protein
MSCDPEMYKHFYPDATVCVDHGSGPDYSVEYVHDPVTGYIYDPIAVAEALWGPAGAPDDSDFIEAKRETDAAIRENRPVRPPDLSSSVKLYDGQGKEMQPGDQKAAMLYQSPFRCKFRRLRVKPKSGKKGGR